MEQCQNIITYTYTRPRGRGWNTAQPAGLAGADCAPYYIGNAQASTGLPVHVRMYMY
jgi:hypothetical protein